MPYSGCRWWLSLTLDILTDDIERSATTADHTVAWGPQVIPPELSLKLWPILLAQKVRGLPLEFIDQNRNGHFEVIGYKDVE